MPIDQTDTPSTTPEPVEIWVCGHTRKCGWKGLEHERLDAPCKRFSTGGLKVTAQVCPKCGNDEFYVRKATPATKAPKGTAS